MALHAAAAGRVCTSGGRAPAGMKTASPSRCSITHPTHPRLPTHAVVCAIRDAAESSGSAKRGTLLSHQACPRRLYSARCLQRAALPAARQRSAEQTLCCLRGLPRAHTECTP
jgi:hypothetical protein